MTGEAQSGREGGDIEVDQLGERVIAAPQPAGAEIDEVMAAGASNGIGGM